MTKKIKLNLEVKIDDLHRKFKRHEFISYFLKAVILALLALITKNI